MTASIFFKDDHGPRSVDDAIASARRPHLGCEEATKASSRLVVCAVPTDAGGPLAADPCFEFKEASVTVVVVAKPLPPLAKHYQHSHPPARLALMQGQQEGQGEGEPAEPLPLQLPAAMMMTTTMATTMSPGPNKPRDEPQPPQQPQPSSPLRSPARAGLPPASTSTLGRLLEPPPPLVLPPAPAAFDTLPAGPSSQPLQQQQQQPPRRVTLATVLTEDLTLTFAAATGEVGVALEGHVQLGINISTTATANPAFASAAAAASVGGGEEEVAAPVLEFDLAVADRGGQVGATTPNAALLVSNKEEEDGGMLSFGPIPETHINGSNNNAPTPPPSSYRCRIPPALFLPAKAAAMTPAPAPAPLALLRFEAKPAVRPVPVRVQQSLLRVDPAAEPNVARIVAQVAVNPNLYMPLVGASLTLHLPGNVILGQELLSASCSSPDAITTAAAKASWAPPPRSCLQWTIPEDVRPGTVLLFQAALPLLAPTGDTTTTTASSSSWPVRATFVAQSRAGLTKVGVAVQPLQQQQQQQPHQGSQGSQCQGGQPYELEVAPLRRRFRVTAVFEP